MPFETIEFEIVNSVARLFLNRPEKLNSFTTQMHREIKTALTEVTVTNGVRCLLLSGRGRGFCAGQDLNDRAPDPSGAPPDLGANLAENYNPLVMRLKTIDIPVVCAVNGVAAGAGANVALACDIVIAAESAKFIQAFCRLGLIPDAGGTWNLPRLVGGARALGLALLGDTVPAQQAADWGMIWRCVPDADLQAEATTLTEHLSQQPTAGLGLIKKAFVASATNTLEQQLDLERDLQRQAGHSRDYREGVAAFVEKRAANFLGK